MGMESINDISNLIIQGWGYAKNAVEFAIITVMIYFVLYFLRGTRAVSVLAGIIMILLFTTFLSLTLNLEVFGWLLENLWTVFSTAMIVIFQPELRRAFAQLGSHIGRHKKIEQKEAIEEIVSAVMQMSFRRCGALIIFERQIGMAAIINSAVALETKINSLLVQSIFYPNSPLHDGAVIVRQGIIAAAHAILPLSDPSPRRNRRDGGDGRGRRGCLRGNGNHQRGLPRTPDPQSVRDGSAGFPEEDADRSEAGQFDLREIQRSGRSEDSCVEFRG